MRRCLCLVATLWLGGCATVVRGTEEQIAFQSTPPDAHVALSTGLTCASTPCDLKVARSDEFTATFTKDGFQPESIRVTTHVSGNGVAAGAGNLLVGGVVGVGVDAYDGANLDHQPNPVVATLKPLVPPPKAAPAKRKRASHVS